MAVDPDRAYPILGKSLMQIGDFMRGYDVNRPKQDRDKYRRYVPRVIEGVLLEDLASAPSLDEPQKAQFQAKWLINGTDNLSNDGEYEVWSRARYASFKAGDYGWAYELYPNVFYWLPMDCSQPVSSSSAAP